MSEELKRSAHMVEPSNRLNHRFEILGQSDAYLPGLSFWTGHAADVDALTVALALYLLANLEDQEADRFERYQCQSISVHIHIRPQKDSSPMMSEKMCCTCILQVLAIGTILWDRHEQSIKIYVSRHRLTLSVWPSV
jgi:hypothetical protein